MSLIIDAWNQGARLWWSWCLHSTWQGLVLLVLVLAVLPLLKRASPHWRYALLFVALLKFLLPPLGMQGYGLFAWIFPPPPIVQADFGPLDRFQHQIVVIENYAAEAPTPMAQPKPPILPLTPAGWGLVIHVLGSFALFVFLTVQVVRLRFRLKRAQWVTRGPLFNSVASVGQALSLRRIPRVYVSSETESPCAGGTMRKFVLLPGWVDLLTDEERRVLLAHELAHLKRWDTFCNWFQILSQVWLWWNPAVWWLNSRIRAERELCCDDLVLSLGFAAGGDYSRLLVDVASHQRNPELAFEAMGMADSFRRLKERIDRAMDSSLRRRTRLSLVSAAVLVAIAAFALPSGKGTVSPEVTHAESELRSLGTALLDHESAMASRRNAANPTTPNFRFGYVDRLFPQLTSPVKVIESFPSDPFDPQQQSYFAATDGPNRLLLLSVGPNGILDVTQEHLAAAFQDPSTLPSKVSDWSYSPTNGTKSKGDVLWYQAVAVSESVKATTGPLYEVEICLVELPARSMRDESFWKQLVDARILPDMGVETERLESVFQNPDLSILNQIIPTDKEVKILSNPKLLIESGREGHIFIGETVPYIDHYDVINDPKAASPVVSPVTGKIDLGFSASIEASPAEAGKVELSLDLKETRQGERKLVRNPLTGKDEPVGNPWHGIAEITNRVRVKDGGTISIVLRNQLSDTSQLIALVTARILPTEGVKNKETEETGKGTSPSIPAAPSVALVTKEFQLNKEHGLEFSKIIYLRLFGSFDIIEASRDKPFLKYDESTGIMTVRHEQNKVGLVQRLVNDEIPKWTQWMGDPQRELKARKFMVVGKIPEGFTPQLYRRKQVEFHKNVLRTLLYAEKSIEEAAAEGSVMVPDPEKGTIEIVDTASDLDKVEEYLKSVSEPGGIHQKPDTKGETVQFFQKPDEIRARRFVIAQPLLPNITSEEMAKTKRDEFHSRLNDIKKNLYGSKTIEEAAAEGRVIYPDPEKGTIDIVDTIENLKKVEDYLADTTGQKSKPKEDGVDIKQYMKLPNRSSVSWIRRGNANVYGYNAPTSGSEEFIRIERKGSDPDHIFPEILVRADEIVWNDTIQSGTATGNCIVDDQTTYRFETEKMIYDQKTHALWCPERTKVIHKNPGGSTDELLMGKAAVIFSATGIQTIQMDRIMSTKESTAPRKFTISLRVIQVQIPPNEEESVRIAMENICQASVEVREWTPLWIDSSTQSIPVRAPWVRNCVTIDKSLNAIAQLADVRILTAPRISLMTGRTGVISIGLDGIGAKVITSTTAPQSVERPTFSFSARVDQLENGEMLLRLEPGLLLPDPQTEPNIRKGLVGLPVRFSDHLLIDNLIDPQGHGLPGWGTYPNEPGQISKWLLMVSIQEDPSNNQR